MLESHPCSPLSLFLSDFVYIVSKAESSPSRSRGDYTTHTNVKEEEGKRLETDGEEFFGSAVYMGLLCVVYVLAAASGTRCLGSGSGVS